MAQISHMNSMQNLKWSLVQCKGTNLQGLDMWVWHLITWMNRISFIS